MGPKIVGLIRLELPIMRSPAPSTRERIAHLGFDSDGQAWGLVERLSWIETAPGPYSGTDKGRIGRVEFVRWVRFNRIPFDPEEVIEAGAWT